MKQIPNYPGYELDDNLDVWRKAYTAKDKRRMKRKKIAKHIVKETGHTRVFLDGKTIYMCTIVCLAYHGLPPQRNLYAVHKNLTRDSHGALSYKSDNVEWARKCQYRIRKKSIVNSDMIKDIKNSCESNRALAKKYDISRATVSKILRGKYDRYEVVEKPSSTSTDGVLGGNESS